MALRQIQSPVQMVIQNAVCQGSVPDRGYGAMFPNAGGG